MTELITPAQNPNRIMPPIQWNTALHVPSFRDGGLMHVNVAKAVVLQAGMLVAINAQGFAVPAHDATAIKVMGVAKSNIDNMQGNDGDKSVAIQRNLQFLFPVDANYPLTQADIGKPAVITTDNTVAVNPPTGEYLAIGDVMEIADGGYVWVEVGYSNSAGRIMIESVGNVSVAPILTFNNLQNCTYENDTLSYTDGVLEMSGSAGYQAVTDKPINITFAMPSLVNFFIGDANNFDDYVVDGFAEGINLELYEGDSQDWICGNALGSFDFKVSKGDVLKLTITDKSLVLVNVTTGQTWTSPQSDYLSTPKYMGAVVLGTEPLTIKAI